MKKYKQKQRYSTPLYLLVPTYMPVKGVTQKIYPAPSNKMIFFASFKTYGGTEVVVNGVCSIVDTAVVETWYRPDIKSDCRIVRAEDGAIYEIITSPENIDMDNQILNFKVKRIKGGV